MNRHTDTRHFRELRLRLVDCARSLRHYRDEFDRVRAECEQVAVEAGANGKNAEERSRNLTIALAKNSAYVGALALLRDAEYEHDRVEQLLEAAKDERRAAEWQIRAKLADGLFAHGVQSDDRDPAGDGAFDDTADSYVNRAKAYETIPEYDLDF